MNRKVLAFVFSAILLLGVSTTVFAAPFNSNRNNQAQQMNTVATTNENLYYRSIGCGNGNGYMQQCYNLMRDENGKVVDENTFNQNLENAIKDGKVNQEDKEYLKDMYNYCLGNDADNAGYRGRGCCRAR